MFSEILDNEKFYIQEKSVSIPTLKYFLPNVLSIGIELYFLMLEVFLLQIIHSHISLLQQNSNEQTQEYRGTERFT